MTSPHRERKAPRGHRLWRLAKPVLDPVLRPLFQRRFQNRELAHFRAMTDPRFFKVHAPFDPRFPRVVYLVRDPRDVLVSFWHYRRMVHRDFGQSMTEFVASDAHLPWAWDAHVRGWLDAPGVERA